MTSREKFEEWFLSEHEEVENSNELRAKVMKMMAWQSWQAAEISSEQKLTDLAVQLANAESKCRELAAESVAMKQNAVKAEKVIMSSKFDYWSDRVELSAVVGRIIETPATSAFLAEVRAQGVEMAMEHMQSSGSLTFGDCYISLNEFAAKLRKGAAL